MLEIRALDGAVEISLHVRPRARTPGVGGSHAGALQVRVQQAPEDGRANEAVRAALAAALGVRRADVELLTGLQARRKRVRIQGDPDALRTKIERLAAI
jgi:uncharacterized protein YggU (UPF0235/DUF167 family)